MASQTDVKTVLKKNKLKNAKSFITKFRSENPFLTGITAGFITLFYPILLSMLVTAMWENQRYMILFILQIMLAVNCIFILPLLILQVVAHNTNMKTKAKTQAIDDKNKAEIQAINDFVQVRKYQEQEKFKLFENATQAKIGLLQAQSQFVMDFSGNFVTEMMKSKAQNLQEGFTTENIRETMDDVINIMGKVLNRFNGIGEQYDHAIQQMQKICEEFGIKLEDLGINTMIDPNESTEALKEQINSVMKGIPPLKMPFEEATAPIKTNSLVDEPPAIIPLVWVCNQCKRENDFNRTRCKKCNLSQAASLNRDKLDSSIDTP
ncbi:hypothetical protein KAR91_62205 [Candidatus Pacearchaeota archaeon]|nr:hypothetical protein [Candidatus Pacearchaeota archaeon]